MTVSGGFFDSARAPNGLPNILTGAGDLDVRLAATRSEIRSAQELRFQVFFEAGGATPDPTQRIARRDVCRFDRVCDHLIVVDESLPRIEGSPAVVGAYRLLRQSVAEANFGFYSAAEFDVGALIARHPGKRFLELGRSCVAQGYRGKRTLELLWRGIWAYAQRHDVDVMFGCASFPGVDPAAHAAALNFLRSQTPLDSRWDVAAVGAPVVSGEGEIAAAAGARTLLRALPPLIKGYWRLGARFSRDAVVDAAFGSTDVLVVLPVEEIRQRYLVHFAPAESQSSMAA